MLILQIEKQRHRNLGSQYLLQHHFEKYLLSFQTTELHLQRTTYLHMQVQESGCECVLFSVLIFKLQ